MGMERNRDLVDRVARRLLDEIGQWDHTDEQFEVFVREMRKLRPETQGAIAITGRRYNPENDGSDPCSLYSVHCGTYIRKYAGGRDCLARLAATAVIARMVDIRREPLPPIPDSPRAAADAR